MSERCHNRTLDDFSRIETAVAEIELLSPLIATESLKVYAVQDTAYARRLIEHIRRKYGDEIVTHLDRVFLRHFENDKVYITIMPNAVMAAIKCGLGLAGRPWVAPFAVSLVLFPEDNVIVRCFHVTKQSGKGTPTWYEVLMPPCRGVAYVDVLDREEFEKLKPMLESKVYMLGYRKKRGFGRFRLKFVQCQD